MTESCSCQWNYGIPAVVAVCGYHAASVTHTPRDGYTMPCPACRIDDVCDACNGSGIGQDGDPSTSCSACSPGCKGCLHSGRALVSLQAGKAAKRWVEEELPHYQQNVGALLLGGKIGRIRRRHR